MIELANHHPRVNILQPGAGVGGHCIAVDPWFIVNQNPNEAKIIRAAREINDSKPSWVVDKINAEIDKLKAQGIAKPTVALLGLAFKPDIDDLRESPAVHIAQTMLDADNANILLVEPNIEQLPSKLESGKLIPLKEAINSADLVVVLVAHKEFTDKILLESNQVINMVGNI